MSKFYVFSLGDGIDHNYEAFEFKHGENWTAADIDIFFRELVEEEAMKDPLPAFGLAFYRFI